MQVLAKAQKAGVGVSSHPLSETACQEPALTATEALSEAVARHWGNTLSTDCNKFSWLHPGVVNKPHTEVRFALLDTLLCLLLTCLCCSSHLSMESFLS